MDEAKPLPNVWLGTSCEDQKTADERIPHLLRCPAAVRFVSAEPLLGPIDLSGLLWGYSGNSVAPALGIRWVIGGGESGPGARPCHVEWIRILMRQCRDVGSAVFVKQLGRWIVGDPGEFAASPTAWLQPDGRTYIPPVLWGRFPDMPAEWPFSLGGKGGVMPEWPADLRVREWPV